MLVLPLGASLLGSCESGEAAAPDAAESSQLSETEQATKAGAKTEPLRSDDEASVPDAEVSTDVPDEPNLKDLKGWHVADGHRGLHRLAWRIRPAEGELAPSTPSKPPRNSEFALDVLLLRDEQLAPGLRVAVTGWMPEHEHGMVRLPVVEEVAPGRHSVTGMLLHMRGTWQLRFQIFAERDSETVTFDVDL